MRKINLILILLIAASSVLFAADATPSGSFLKQRATSVNQLYNQVSKDSKVRKLYAKHFGISEKEFLGKLKNNIVLISLKNPIKVNSYYVGKSGRFIYVKKKLLPKGSMVFASKDGKPIMLWSCGNPLVTILPKEPKKKKKEIALKPQPQVAAPTAPPIKVEEFTEVVEAPPAPSEALPIVEDLMPQAPAVQVPLPETSVITPSVSSPLLGVIGGIAPIMAVLASAKDDEPVTPVPEPSTFIGMISILAAGAAFLRFKR